MSAFLFEDAAAGAEVDVLRIRSPFESDECVFKKCCEKYKKKKGKHCKKCPRK